jgi:hypothetical protein
MSLRRSLALALASVSLVSSAWASPHVLKPGESYTELTGVVTSADAYFDANDQSTALGATFEQRTLKSHSELGWKKRASVWLDLPVVSRTYSADAGGSATSTGLGDLGLGVRVALVRGGMPVSLSLGWTAPMGSNRRLFPGTTGGTGLDGTKYGSVPTATGQPHTFFDAGLQSLSASLAVGGSLGKSAFYTLGTGYTSRYLTIGARGADDRYADFVTTDASLGLWLGGRLLVSGTWHGESQGSQGRAYDRIAPTPAPTGEIELQTRFAAIGSRVTWRVDDKMDVFAGAQFPVSGRNTLDANSYYAGMAWKQTGLGRLAGAFGGTKN